MMNIIIRRSGEFYYTVCAECGRRFVLDGNDKKDAEAMLEEYGWEERGGAVVCPACIDTRSLRLRSAANLIKAPSVAQGFNRDDILSEIEDMSVKLGDIQYFDGDIEELTNALEGDGEEACEFQLSCSLLNNDLEELRDAFIEENVTKYFDVFFSAVTQGCTEHYSMFGDDDGAVNFYQLIGYDADYASSRAAEKLKRLTKDELLNAANQCFKVAAALFDIRDRYSRLQIAMEVVLKRNGRLMDTVEKLNMIYDDASGHFDNPGNVAVKEFNKLLYELPDNIWVE